MAERKYRKRLSIDIPAPLFKEIKIHALLNDMTITKWVCNAIIARIKLEKPESK